MKIHFYSFGCKVNLYDTESLKQLFYNNGFEPSEDGLNCDVYVVNSCTVTETGDKKVLKLLRRLRRENPNAIIALTGCMPQADMEKAMQIMEADIVTGTKNRAELLDMVNTYITLKNKSSSHHEYSNKDTFETSEPIKHGDSTRAFIKIQDGCDMYCSYCIIPYTRGHFRSRPLADITAEVTGLAENGYKEIVLAGINLSFYGVDIGLTLTDAISAVCGIDSVERVRLSSLEPERITDEDIAAWKTFDKLCPHFHLSLQSGCGKTLKAMNRRYVPSEYETLVNKLRSNFEHCGITTDMIVGFPNETDEDFWESMRFAEKIGFADVHIFPYSKRNGTKAASMDGQVSVTVKKQRVEILAERMAKSRKAWLEKQIGLVFPVLFEQEKEPFVWQGYTPNYILVKISKNSTKICLQNQVKYVKIVDVCGDYCLGELI